MSTRNRSTSRSPRKVETEVRHYGVIPGDLEAVTKVVRALRAPTRRLRFVYEAGPCGFGLHRYLTTQGEDCVVVNPSSMPKPPTTIRLHPRFTQMSQIVPEANADTRAARECPQRRG
jgi:transposase